MLDCNETDKSQTSQELAKLLASRKADILLVEDSQIHDNLSSKHELPDIVLPQQDLQRRKYSLLGLGQGQPMSQTQQFSDDIEEEGSHGSQKENLHSSTDSSKLGPNVLCSSNENAYAQSKEGQSENLGVFSQSCPLNPVVPTFQPLAPKPHDEQSEPLQRFSVSLDCPGGSSIDTAGDVSTRPCQTSDETLQSKMICSTFGTSSPERLDGIRRALSNNLPTSNSRYVDSQSQDSDKASQASGPGSQDDEPQAQVVPQYDMSELRQLESEFYSDSQSQSQATQSTQPATASDDSNDVINDKTWANFTGIQIPPNRRYRYLASAKEGAALQAVRNDTFYDGLDSDSSAPLPADDDIFRQFPAGMPDPSCDSEQETQLVETQLVDNPQQENQWVPPVQFPAGYGPASEEEGMATQIEETEVATQIMDDDSSIAEAGLVDASHPVVAYPPLPARPAFSRVKSPNNALEIVPDSEPPVPSPVNSPKCLSSTHVETLKRQPLGASTVNQLVEVRPPSMDVEDEDDDDDEPLASIVNPGRHKDVSIKCDPSVEQMPPPPPKRSMRSEGKRRQITPANNQGNNITQVVTKARTSLKRKDPAAEKAVKAESSSKKKGKGRKGEATELSAHRRSTRPTRNRRSLAESDSEEGGDDDGETVHMKEEDTETGDEVYMTPGPSVTGEGHNKRKRGISSSVSVPRKITKKEHSQTPANRTPRFQSTSSVNARKIIPLPLLRVLALYTDGYWYPGTVGDFQKPDSYKIVYDDNSAEWARTGSMRRLELRVGDEVMDSTTKNSGTVSEIKEDIIVVSASFGPNFNLPYRNLCITCDKVEAQWEDRELTRTVLASIHDTSRHSAFPEGANGFLRGCGIIITSNPKAHEWNKEKNEIFASMIENGATLIEDWSDALQINGTYAFEKNKGKVKKGKGRDSGNRKPKSWKITKDQAQWFEDPDKSSIQRVFVLADTVCQKPKYLMALALGVPCLSTDWMTDSLQKRDPKDWGRYLLPKGLDPPHNVRLSQSVNLDWGTTPEHLTNIMDNPYAHKLFAGMSVLCVGDDYIPEQHEERMGANKHGDFGLEALKTVTNRSKITSGVALIILAMGASQVTAATNFHDINKDEYFDYVVFKDLRWRSKYGSALKEGTSYASWAWVKQSLIRGQMLPLF